MGSTQVLCYISRQPGRLSCLCGLLGLQLLLLILQYGDPSTGRPPACRNCAEELMIMAQDIASQGLYHPSVNLSIAARMVVNYTPADYPTDAQRSDGFVCGCTNYYNNPCRAEFRKVMS